MAEGLLDQYREKLKFDIGRIRIFGQEEFKDLDQVFVELTVIEDFEIPRDAEYKALMDKELRRRRTLFPKDETEEHEDNNPEETDEKGRKSPRKVRRTVKPEELLEAGKRSQVVGAPGCGKTTLLYWLALQIANTSDRLPVFIEMKRLQKEQFDTLNKGFSKFLFENGVSFRFESAETPSKELDLLEDEFNKLFATGRLVVLLDGLDEIAESERHRLRTAVENYVNKRNGGLTLIISTRPYGYLQNFADLKAMEIESLSDIQIEQFLDHWFKKPNAETVKANLRKNPNLRSLARFPFLLAFIANLNSGGDISRIDLYREIVSKLINTLDKDKSAKTFKVDDPDGVLKPKFLKRFAFAQLFEKREIEFSSRLIFHIEDIYKAAKTFLKEEDPTTSPRHFVHDLCATPLFRAVEKNRYTFAHLTIQEFLAAEELSQREDCQKLFIQAFFNRQLAEMDVLPLTIGLSEKPDEYYYLLSKLPEAIGFTKLCLEGRSLGYHRIISQDIFYQFWQTKLTQFGLQKNRLENIFLNKVFTSFSTSELIHSKNLVSGFQKNLQNKDSCVVRINAAQALGKFGVALPEIVKSLESLLQDQDFRVCLHAAEALKKLGAVSAKVIFELLVLAAKSEQHDEKPARILIQLGASSAEADSWGYLELGEIYANSIVRIGKTFPDGFVVFSGALRDDDLVVRRIAADVLGEIGIPLPEAIIALSDALQDKDSVVRRNAAEALEKIGTPLPEAITALLGAINDRDPDVRVSVVRALGKIRVIGINAVAELSILLNDESEVIRRTTANVLCEIGFPLPEAIKELSSELRDRNSDVRRSAAKTLGRLGVESPEAITELSNALRDQDTTVRQHCAEGLIQLGAVSPTVLVVLENASKDGNWSVRHYAIDALFQIGLSSPLALTTLANLLNNKNKSVCRHAVKAFISYKDFPSVVFPSTVISALNIAASDEDSVVSQLATEALRKLGIASPQTASKPSNALNELDSSLHQRVTTSFEKPHINSPEVISKLSNATVNGDLITNQPSPETLNKLSKTSGNVMKILENALCNKDQNAFQIAIKELEGLGFDSPEFCDHLRKLLYDTNPEICIFAIQSLGYFSTDIKLLTHLWMKRFSLKKEIRETAIDSYNKYKFKLEVLGLLPS